MQKEKKPGFFTRIFKPNKSGCCAVEFEEINENAENAENEGAKGKSDESDK